MFKGNNEILENITHVSNSEVAVLKITQCNVSETNHETNGRGKFETFVNLSKSQTFERSGFEVDFSHVILEEPEKFLFPSASLS